MTQGSRFLVSLGLLLLIAAGLDSCAAQGKVRSADAGIPVAAVKQADIQLRVNATGELRSTKTAMLVAPTIGNGSLQIIHLLKAGTHVKAGDPVFDFDPSQQRYNLEQNKSDFAQAEEAIVKAEDDAAVQVAQDQTTLLKAQFAVRQAQLDVSKSALISAIDAQKNQLALDEAKRALAQLQEDIKSHTASGEATLAVDQEKAHKAKLAMDQAEENIKNMQVRSPIDGIVIIQQNENASGGFFFSGMTLPEYQAGDQVSPGNTIANVIDMDSMELTARVSESDRINVKAGQAVDIYVDALPGKVFPGTVKTVAGTTGDFFFGSDAGGTSEVTIQLNHPDVELRPGFTAHLAILGDRLQNALWIPRESVFERDGKPIVYSQSQHGFEPHPIQIRYLSEGMAVIAGLQIGTNVAVIDPEKGTGPLKPTGVAGPVGAPR